MVKSSKLICSAMVFVLAAWPQSAFPADTNLPDQVNRKVLRVCSSPENLPYSNEKGEGFENKIAEIIASELKLPIEYTWYPLGMGLARRTLAAKKCDVILQTIQADEYTLNTNAYYRSTYALVFKKSAGLDGITSVFDPRLKGKKLSNQGGPVGDQVAKAGLMQDAKSYRLMVDRRYDNPEKEIIDDVRAGVIDVGVVWGPLGGYAARPYKDELTVVPLLEEVSGTSKLEYRMTMGVRVNEVAWKRQLNDIIKKRQGDIDKVLMDFGVPLIDEDNKVLAAPRS
ncbi:MAG: quinoprotein dehydrogenase-associated putative ABC transporter substrate-binding protein [Hyphomicrobium sp.]